MQASNPSETLDELHYALLKEHSVGTGKSCRAARVDNVPLHLIGLYQEYEQLYPEERLRSVLFGEQ